MSRVDQLNKIITKSGKFIIKGINGNNMITFLSENIQYSTTEAKTIDNKLAQAKN